MAKLISIVGTLSGKLAGTVYSHNRWGQYIRQLVMPTQPRTTFQSEQRARVAAVAESWRDRTATERLRWATFAPQIVRSDVLGQPLSYNGFTAYMLVNVERDFVGLALMTSPPDFWQGTQPDEISFAVAAGGMSWTGWLVGGAGTVDTGTSHCIAWSCPWQAPGALFPKTWRAFSVIEPSTPFPVALETAWNARFGAIQAADNRRYFLGITCVDVVAAPPPSTVYVSTRVTNSVLSTLV